MIREYLLANIIYRPVTPYSYFELAVLLQEFYKDDVEKWRASRNGSRRTAFADYTECGLGVDIALCSYLKNLRDVYVHDTEYLDMLENRMLDTGANVMCVFCKYFDLEVEGDRLSAMYRESLQYVRECRKSFGI